VDRAAVASHAEKKMAQLTNTFLSASIIMGCMILYRELWGANPIPLLFICCLFLMLLVYSIIVVAKESDEEMRTQFYKEAEEEESERNRAMYGDKWRELNTGIAHRQHGI